MGLWARGQPWNQQATHASSSLPARTGPMSHQLDRPATRAPSGRSSPIRSHPTVLRPAPSGRSPPAPLAWRPAPLGQHHPGVQQPAQPNSLSAANPLSRQAAQPITSSAANPLIRQPAQPDIHSASKPLGRTTVSAAPTAQPDSPLNGQRRLSRTVRSPTPRSTSRPFGPPTKRPPAPPAGRPCSWSYSASIGPSLDPASSSGTT